MNSQDKEDDMGKDEFFGIFVRYNDLLKGDCNFDWIV